MKTTITQVFLKAGQRPSTQKALTYRKDRNWLSYSWQEFFSQAESLGCALLSLNIKKGDRVAILANSRPEWAIADMGSLGVGAVVVPIYQSNRSDEIAYILNDSETKVLILEDEGQLNKWLSIANACPSVETVVCMQTKAGMPEDIYSWSSFIDEGEEYSDSHPDAFSNLCQTLQPQDWASIIYTSGTTGLPKGVLLSHRQIMSEVSDVFSVVSVDQFDSSLTFLPYAHVLGRVELWGSVYTGFELAFAESIEKIRANLAEVKPTILIGVPRIFEKIYAGILTQAEASPIKQRIFNWAISVGREVSKCRIEKRPIPLTTLPNYLLAKKLVFSPLKEKLGGRLRFAVSGGAPLNKDIAEFFHAADILILEGYGLTETTAAVTLNTPFDYRFGTVGRPLPDVEIKIASDGEVLIKSDKNMLEYYKNPEATREVMRDGYFATGDIGEITEDGFLRITDRKKDLIKTAGGKYVAPQRLEGFLKLNRFISNVLIHGDQKKYIVALLTLNEPAIVDYARDQQISYQDFSSLISNENIKSLVRSAVAEANSQLSSFETIKQFSILPHDFTIENGELTPSLKVKRKYCDQKYREIIESLYD